MFSNAARRQVHHVAQGCLQAAFVDVLAGALQVDIDRQRPGDADGVADLDGAAICQVGGDDILAR